MPKLSVSLIYKLDAIIKKLYNFYEQPKNMKKY